MSIAPPPLSTHLDQPSTKGCDWLLLSPCYVETDGDVEGWREFFSALGVRDRLIIRKERRTLTPSELVSLCVGVCVCVRVRGFCVCVFVRVN